MISCNSGGKRPFLAILHFVILAFRARPRTREALEQKCKKGTSSQSEETAFQEKLIEEGSFFDENDKKWHTKFLYIEKNVEQMQDNCKYVKKHTERFNRKMSKYPKKDQEKLNEVMRKGLVMGSFKPASEMPHLNKWKKRYIPMNIAFSSKDSCSVRPTWDCSSTCSPTDKSFNASVLRGPVNLQIHRTMLLLRSKKYFNQIDLQKGYFNIVTDNRTQSLSRIFIPMKDGKVAYGDLNATLVEFVCVSMVFGQKAASSSLEVCLKKAGFYFGIDEKIRSMLEMLTYCDDLGIISDDLDGLKYAMEQTETLIKKSNIQSHP